MMKIIGIVCAENTGSQLKKDKPKVLGVGCSMGWPPGSLKRYHKWCSGKGCICNCHLEKKK
jgi:hypothetical protein